MKKDNNRYIDLSDIKENDLDKTSSFTDLMSRSERRKRKMENESLKNEITKKIDNDINDIEEMITEKKKSTKDLTLELEKAKKEYNKSIEEIETKDDKEDNLAKTQILELTRQMKFNFEETKKENKKKKKKGISVLNVIGEVNLLCIGYYIYLLTFTNYQDNQSNYLIAGGIIVLLVLLFGLSIVTSKKVSKLFNILNILALLSFIAFNTYILLY